MRDVPMNITASIKVSPLTRAFLEELHIQVQKAKGTMDQKVDRETMTREARRTLEGGATEDRAAALRYLLMTEQLNCDTVKQIALEVFGCHMASSPEALSAQKVKLGAALKAAFFPDLPTWCKVGQWIFNHQGGPYGVYQVIEAVDHVRNVATLSAPKAEAASDAVCRALDHGGPTTVDAAFMRYCNPVERPRVIPKFAALAASQGV
jgi:hypothetical protein